MMIGVVMFHLFLRRLLVVRRLRRLRRFLLSPIIMLMLALLLPGGVSNVPGVKRYVWVKEDDVPVCLGKVGFNNKFCIKLCEEDKSHCGTGRHSSKFQVGSNVAYIHVNEHQVHCTPVLPLDGLNQAQRDKLCSLTWSSTEWESIFGSIQSGHLPEWLVELEDFKNESEEEENEEVDVNSLQPLSPMPS